MNFQKNQWRCRKFATLLVVQSATKGKALSLVLGCQLFFTSQTKPDRNTWTAKSTISQTQTQPWQSINHDMALKLCENESSNWKPTNENWKVTAKTNQQKMRGPNCKEVFPAKLMWWCGGTHMLGLMCVKSCVATCVWQHVTSSDHATCFFTWWCFAWLRDASITRKNHCMIVRLHSWRECSPTCLWAHMTSRDEGAQMCLIFFTWWFVAWFYAMHSSREKTPTCM